MSGPRHLEFQHFMQKWGDSLIGTPGLLSSIVLQGMLAVPGKYGIHRTAKKLQTNVISLSRQGGKEGRVMHIQLHDQGSVCAGADTSSEQQRPQMHITCSTC